MSDKKKLFLLVDDSEIDLEVLRTVLEESFDTLEATSASEAMDYLQDPYIDVDAMLLDISMPEMDGFKMLDLMEQENISAPPVFMISAEATQSNVTKALLHHVKGFIRKPFQKEDVFRQIYNGLGITKEDMKKIKAPSQELVEQEEVPASKPEFLAAKGAFSFKESMEYITNLRSVYSQFLIQMELDLDHYSRMVSLMLIFLECYELQTSLEWEKMELISHAAFFVEIGRMAYPFGDGADVIRKRAQAGGEILSLNTSRNCAFFVDAASAICRGFYHKNDAKPESFEGEYAPFVQMCILAERLDTIYFGHAQYTASEYPHAVRMLKKMEPTIDQEIFKLLISAESEVNKFYSNQRPKNWL